MRLLTDAAFIEEFDIVVDEIAAAYLAGEFTGEEKEQVEKYFLRSPERQKKVQFIGEMLRQVSAEQRERIEDPLPAADVAGKSVVKPSLLDRVRALFGGQPLATAATFAALVLVAGLGIWFLMNRSSSPSFATLELNLSSPSRNTGSEIPKIAVSNVDELRIKLNLPDRNPPPKSYRADLRGENISLPRLPIAEQNAKSLTVIIPTEDLTRGTYAIELNAVNENGAEEAIRGAYLFAVE